MGVIGNIGGGLGQPSLIIQTSAGNYTVPAGKYVSVSNTSSGNFTINGTTVALAANSYFTSGSKSSGTFATIGITAGGTYSISIATSYSSTIQCILNGNVLVSQTATGGSSNYQYPPSSATVGLQAGDTLSFTNSQNGANCQVSLSGTREITGENPYWLPEGTTINGNRFVVSEFTV